MIDMSDCANVYMWLVTYEFVTGREATDLLLLRGIRRRRYDQSSNRSVDKGGQAGGTAHGTWLGTPLCLRAQRYLCGFTTHARLSAGSCAIVRK